MAGAWRHTRYSERTGQNDLGLLRLRQPVEGIQPISLPTSSDSSKIKSAKSYRILGWGQDQNGDVAKFLRAANLDDQNAAAQRAYGRLYNPATMIASGKYLKSERLYAGGCHGDSGGPLTTKVGSKVVLAGVTSWGSAQGCDRGKPTIFTRVSYYLNDIKAGTALVRRSVYGRLIPENISKPIISGDARVGSSLTCLKGDWSEETDQVEIEWVSPSRISGSNNPQQEVKQEDAGQNFICAVTGINKNGKDTVSASKNIMRMPTVSVKPTISGIVSGDTPKVGQIITCGGQKWADPIEQESKRKWYVAGYSYDGVPRNETLIPDETNSSLTLTKEIILQAQGKSLFCKVQALNAGGIGTAWASVSIPQLSKPYPYVSITGYDSGSMTPAVGTVLECKTEKPEQYEKVSYEWTFRTSPVAAASSPVGTESKLTLTKDLILSAKEKYLVCQITVENLVGSGTQIASQYIPAPVKPSSVYPDIKNITSSVTANSGSAQCVFRELNKGETALITWGAGLNSAKTDLLKIIGFGPTLPITGAIYDDIVGGYLVCKVVITNLAGDTSAIDSLEISAPEILYNSKTGHYYQYIASNLTWLKAREAALGMTYNGMKGYLATPNSADENSLIQRRASGVNVWIGITDAQSEGCWRYADGPEANQAFFATASAINCPVSGGYSNWGSGEPNNAGAGQNLGMMYGSSGVWDDTANVDGRDYNGGKGYVVEFGGPVNLLSPDPANSTGITAVTISPSDSATVAGNATFTYRVTPERFATSDISRVGIKIADANGARPSSTSNCPSGISYYNCYTSGSNVAFGEAGIADTAWSTTALTGSMTLDTTNWANGKYTVIFYAIDSMSRSGSTAPISFTVNNANPTIAITSPASGIQVRGNTSFVASAKPDSNGTATISRVGVKIQGPSGFSSSLFSGICPTGISYYSCFSSGSNLVFTAGSADVAWNTSNLTNTYSLNTTSWPNGSYSIKFFVSDSANRQAVSDSLTFTVANADPTISITSLSDSATVRGAFSITATAAPDSGGTATIVRSGIKISGSTGWSATSYSSPCPTGISSYSCFSSGTNLTFGAFTADYAWNSSSTSIVSPLNTTAWPNGSYTVQFFTIDSSGRFAKSEIKTFYTDNKPPTISLTSPTASSVVKGTALFTGRALPDSSGSATITRVGVRVTGPSGFGPSNYSGTCGLNVSYYSCYSSGTNLSFGTTGNADYAWNSSSNDVQFNLNTSAWANGSYTIYLFAADSSGRFAISDAVNFIITPTVSNVVATSVAQSPGTMTLTWSAPLNTTGVTDYQIEYATAGGNYSIFPHTASTATSAIVSGLSTSTLYSFRVTPVLSGSVNTLGASVSPTASTGAALVYSKTSFTDLSGWSVAGDSTWKPTISSAKLRVISSNGGAGGAVNTSKFDLSKGIDAIFKIGRAHV